MRAFGTESGFHDRGASAWGELSGNQQLLSDVAQGFSVGQGQVAVFRGVDLGGLGEDKTVFFIQVGGENAIQAVKEGGIHLSAIRIVHIIELVVGADHGTAGKLCGKVDTAQEVALLAFGGNALDE